MSRIINEDAVTALLQIKIDALQERIDKLSQQGTPLSGILIGQYIAAQGAMRVCQKHLKFCPDAAVDPGNAGGVFPIAEAWSITI